MAASSLVLLLLAPLVLGAPLSPDAAFSWRHPIGVLLLFLGWAFAGISWGEWIRKFLRITPSLLARLGFGGLAFALLGGLLGHLRLFFDLRIFYFLLAAIGPLLVLYTEIREKRFSCFAHEKRERHVPLLILNAFFVILFLQALFPSQAIDPLWINLTSIRGWINSGGIKLIPDQPFALAANVWDYIYFWPHLLLGGRGDLGLPTAQIFAQWTHLIFGSGVAILALHRIFISMAEGNQGIAWLAVLAGVAAPALAGTLPVVANDWGAIGWVLFGFSLAHQEKRYWIGSAIMGLGVAANFSNIYFTAPLVLMLAASHSENQNFAFLRKIFFCFLLGISPLILRNLILTHSFLVHPPMVFQGNRYFFFVDQSPFIAVSLIAPIFYWFMQKTWSRTGYFALALWFGFLWFSLTVGKQGGPRLMEVGLPLLAGFGVVSLGRVVQDFRPDLTHNKIVYGVLGAVLLLPTFSWLQPMHFSKLGNLSDLVYDQIGGRAEAWIRHNVEPNTLVVSLAEPRLYYLSGHSVIRAWDVPEFDHALRDSKSMQAALEFLESKGVRYVLDSNDLKGVQYYRPFVESFWLGVNDYRAAIVFQTQESRVVDTSMLLARLRRRSSRN